MECEGRTREGLRKAGSRSIERDPLAYDNQNDREVHGRLAYLVV